MSKLTDTQLCSLSEKTRALRRERLHVNHMRTAHPELHWKELIDGSERLADALERDLVSYMKEVLE